MFKFSFDLEEEEESDLNLPGPSSQPTSNAASTSDHNLSTPKETQKCYHVTLDELLESLPPSISYSPIYVPGLDQPLLRRDLFDARFQLYQRDDGAAEEMDSGKETGGGQGGDGGDGEAYVDSSTDLVPGLYEGGLKTWEGGVDLVEVLRGVAGVEEWVRGARVLEVGCGTSLPSAFLLSSLFASGKTLDGPAKKTTLHLQDYNKPVLSLVSLPNLLLALLPHFPPEAFHPPAPGEDDQDEPDADDDEGERGQTEIEVVLPDTTQPGSLNITKRLKEAFKRMLEENGVELRFTYGAWGGLASDLRSTAKGLGTDLSEKGRKRAYDLVLTSETIYAEESVDDLIGVLRGATAKVGSGEEESMVKKVEVGLEESLGDLTLERWRATPLREGEGVVLVAAKVLYFGVGGGLQDFLRKVQADGGWYENVKEWVVGVGRKVVRVGW